MVCCALDRAPNPPNHANLPHVPENATLSEKLREFVKRSEDAK
jgi:hypothetical protein